MDSSTSSGSGGVAWFFFPEPPNALTHLFASGVCLSQVAVCPNRHSTESHDRFPVPLPAGFNAVANAPVEDRTLLEEFDVGSRDIFAEKLGLLFIVLAFRGAPSEVPQSSNKSAI